MDPVKIAIGNVLKANANLDTATNGQIFTGTAQGSEPPFVVFSLVGRTQRYDHGGDCRVNTKFFEFSIVTRSATDGEDIAEEVISAIHGISSEDTDDIQFAGVFVRNEFDFYKHSTRTHHKVIDVEINFSYK